MSHDEVVVGRFHRRLTGWLLLRQAVAAVTLWAYLWGTAVLILKVAQGTSVPTLLWGLLGLPVALGLAAWVALRRVPARPVLRAVLDGKVECGGLLMAGAEVPLGEWEVKPAAEEMPRIQWHARRPLGFLAVACAFVALAFAIPARTLALGENALDMTRLAERLAEQVRVLEQEKIIDPERATDLQKKIEELRSHAAGRDPAKTLEALDHLDDTVRQAARQAAEANARQANQLGQVEAGAEAVQKAVLKLDQKNAAELMKEMAALAQQASAESKALQGELGENLAEAIKEGKLTPEQLKNLAAAAKAGKESLARGAKKLHDAKLIDADQLKACEGGKCDGEGLAKFLEKNGGKKSLKEGLKKQEGKGGVNDDGPGETPLDFGDRTTAEGAKFKEEALPPADLAALKESQLRGVGKAEPKRDPKAGPPQSGGLTGAAAGGGSANAAPVLPQHRATVERYFDRPMK